MFRKFPSINGGILLMSLVILGVLTIIMIASMAYISRQFRATVEQESAARAFQVAEAGVYYALWHLENVEEDIINVDQPSIKKDVRRDIEDPESERIGEFHLFTEEIDDDIRVTSYGMAEPGIVRCEALVATLTEAQQPSGKTYFVISSWDHLLGCDYESETS